MITHPKDAIFCTVPDTDFVEDLPKWQQRVLPEARTILAIRVEEGNIRPYIHTYKGMAICITVGNKWLKANLTSEEWASYVTERLG